MSQIIVAIHQPNFFPWLGYFDKIARSDMMILLDNVQFPKTGGTWTNRVKLAVNGAPAWVTLPITRNYSGTRLISEMRINETTDWRRKLLKTIQTNYGKAPYFKKTQPLVEHLIMNPTESVAEYNISAIRSICAMIGINPEKLVIGSTVNAEGTATDLLINMTRAVGGTAYMCGGGAGGYQEDEKFAEAGVKLLYQDYSHPGYLQTGSNDFIMGLSIIDALMHLGQLRVKELFMCGKPDAR